MRPASTAEERFVHVDVLGELRLRIDGVERSFPSGRPGRLLAALVLARGRVVRTDVLIDTVWADEPPEDPRAALHTTVARVRRALGPASALLSHRPPGYFLAADGVSSDADTFTSLAAVARRDGDVAALEQALALWRGPAWAELADDLARTEALRLEEERVALREERAAALLATGRGAEAVAALRALVGDSPFRERPVALLMRALHATGDVAGALAAYDGHRLHLAEELGLDPSAELVDLHRRVLDRSLEPEVPDARPLAGHGGAGAAAGTTGPPGIHQPVADSGSRPAQGASEAPAVPHGTRLFGRESHLAAVGGIVGAQRLVTLVGPGGVGKTSLAAAIARSADEPVWWVDLAQVSDPTAVALAVAEGLGTEPAGEDALLEALRRRFATAEGLLVLDNCEHVLGATADVVGAALTAGQGVHVLATSRERLGTPQEQVFPLPPLQLPPEGGPVEALEQVPAVAFFLERAAAVAPGVADDPEAVRKVAKLIRMLDGLPLAIELAAGRVGSVTVDDLADRLAGRLDLLRSSSRWNHARHRTLSATVDWSFDLLAPDEQRVLLGLSVFAGPFDLAAAEAVLGEGAGSLVADLVDRSLVVGPGVVGRGKYRLLETLRAFARSKVTPETADALGDAHLRWATGLAAAACQGMLTADEGRWSTELDEALPDLRAAFRRAMTTGDLEAARSLVTSLQRWAYLRVRPDVLGWALEVLEQGGAGPGVYLAASNHCWMLGRFPEAREHARAGVVAAGGPSSLEGAACVDALGDHELGAGDLIAAEEAYTAAGQVAEQHGAWEGAAYAAAGVVLTRAFGGSPTQDALERLRGLARRTSNPTTLAWSAYAEGEAAASTDTERALQDFERAISLAASVGNRVVVGVSMTAQTALIAVSGPLTRSTVDQALRAIRHWHGSGNENLFVTCLRNVVPLLSRLGSHAAVVELLAALEASASDHPSYGSEAERLAACLQLAHAAMPSPDVDEAQRLGRGRTTVAAAEAAVIELGQQRDGLP